MNWVRPDRGELYCFIGPPLIVSFRDFCGMNDEQAMEAVRLYRERYADKGLFENVPYEGIEQTLRRLKLSGRRLAVASSKPEVFASRILDKFSLSQYFDFIGGAELDGSRDDKLDVIEYTLESLGKPRCNEVLMVGDRFYDAEGAKAAGIDSMGVLYGFGSEKELVKAGTNYIAHSPQEIADIILDENN